MASPIRQTRRLSRDQGGTRQQTPSESGIPRPRSGSQPGIPVAASKTLVNRQVSTQPLNDLAATHGAESELRNSKGARMRQPSIVRPDIGNEDLRAQLKTVQYELESLKQDREVTRLQQEKELREAQTKAEADGKRAQASENSANIATNKYDALARELQELQVSSTDRQHILEKQLRAAQGVVQTSKEDKEEICSEMATMERTYKHQLSELEKRCADLQTIIDDMQSNLGGKSTELQQTRNRLSEKEKECGDLENSVLALKSQKGDSNELATLRAQLSEHVNHVRKLEKNNSDQLIELRQLRETNKAVKIVEEEKRGLERKVRRIEAIERELGEAKFQRQILEEERKSWTLYLQGNSSEGSSPEFDSPEALSRALAEERMEHITLSERLGAVQPLLSEKEQIIDGLAQETRSLKAEVNRLRSTTTSPNSNHAESRSKTRLERQRRLLSKEVEYLRAQLRTFDSEDTTQDLPISANMDELTRRRIIELEDIVAQYQKELEAANAGLTISGPESMPEPGKNPTKRALPDAEEPDEQLGMLSRKTRKLQDELSTAQQRNIMLDRELEACRAQINSLQEMARTRILSLRNNPTDDFEAVKLSQIHTLRTENEGLHALLERKKILDTVPRASLIAKEQELEDWKARVAEREKRMLRLKQSWAAKALELRQAVASILGWKVEFAPNGKFKLSSIFYAQGDEDDHEPDSGLGTNYLIFDGEKGTVQVSGGPDGEFARDIKGLVKFWVEGRKEIPGLMAACTLEFYERTTRALRM